MIVGARSIAPIISAASSVEAAEKAHLLADDLVQRRLPWLMEGGITKPPKEPRNMTVVIGEPVMLHRSRSHR